jgi:hypothetical protein
MCGPAPKIPSLARQARSCEMSLLVWSGISSVAMMLTADEHRAAPGTVGGLAGGIVDIAGVDIVEAGIGGDLPRHA